jgi:heat shock protein HslJ
MPLLALTLALGSLAANTVLVGSTWHPDVIYSLPGSASISPSSPTQVVGNGSCNHFFGVYTVTGNSIQSGPSSPTGRPVRANLELETAFFSVLQDARTCERDDHTVVLFDESGEEMAQFAETDGA